MKTGYNMGENNISIKYQVNQVGIIADNEDDLQILLLICAKTAMNDNMIVSTEK